MKTEYKTLIGLFLLSVLIITIGALFKILHWNGGNNLLFIGMICQMSLVVFGVVLIFKKFIL
jgi:hypothetical protein